MFRGLDWDTHMDLKKKCTVKDLLTELYEKVRIALMTDAAVWL